MYPSSTNVLSGPTIYNADCWFEDKTAPNGLGDFSSAIVKVNGHELNGWGGCYFYLDNLGLLDVGDPVTLAISEERLGDISVVSSVPASVTSFMLTPSLPSHGTQNTATSYTMSWTGNGADVYTCEPILWDLDKTTGNGREYPTTATSISFGQSDLLVSGNPAPFLTFQLETDNEEVITGYLSGSELLVSGVTVVSQDNL